MRNKYFHLFLFLLPFFSCKKFLDEKSDKRLATPQTIQDLQAILDNIPILNRTPSAANTGGDEYYLLSSIWDGLSNITHKQAYVWDANTQFDDDWSNMYKIVFYANTVLDNLGKLKEQTSSSWNTLKAASLFYRAHAFFWITQMFGQPYNKNEAENLLGIPLRLNADFSEPSQRQNLEKTYSQIEADLKVAAELLPEIPLYKTRPGKAAAFAMLARINLIKENYALAKTYADSCLLIHSHLINYATDIITTAANPFARFNKEVIFHSTNLSSTTLSSSRAKIDSILYNSYTQDDLRKATYFRNNNDGTFSFKGSYDGQGLAESFSGIASDELFLIKAECNARLEKISEAMDDLNTLLNKRWRTNTFIPLTAENKREALNIILKERRKELFFRSLRWSDLRRLNRNDNAEITIERKLNGVLYTLSPNDARYTLLIPSQVISITQMLQNPR